MLLLWTAYLARWGILLVYLSALIAIGISPLAAWIARHPLPGTTLHIPRWAAALAIYLAVLIVVIAPGGAVIPPVVDQAQQLSSEWPTLLAPAQRFLMRHGLISRPLSVNEVMETLPFDLRTTLLHQFSTVLGGLFGLFMILVLSLYLMHDAQRWRELALSLAPRARRRQARVVIDQIAGRIGAWMAGQLMLSGIIGATTALGLGIIGVPYFYVLAMIAAVGELIPIAGPIIAAVPGILLALTISWETALAVLVFYVVQQQLENNLLVPKLMQHQVGLTASAVIIAVTIGSAILGVLGAMIAVPTAAILQVTIGAIAGPPDTSRD